MVSILHDSKRKRQENIATDDSLFNAAEYLFVSRRIAKRLPNSPVAQIILSFHTPWPRQSYTKKSRGTLFRDGISYGLGNFLGVFAYGLGGFLQLPRGVQDGVVHVSSSIAGGYVVLFHTQLFVLYPALAFLPLFCFCVFVHYLLNSRKRKEQSYSVISIGDGCVVDDQVSTVLEERRPPSAPIATPHNRRASLLQGIALIQDAQSQLDRDRSDSDSSMDYESPAHSSSAYSSINDSKVDDQSHRSSSEGAGVKAPSGFLQVNNTYESDHIDLCSEDFSISISIGESSKDVSTSSSYLHYDGDIVVSDEVSQSVDNLYQASENRSSGYSTPDSDGAHSDGVGSLNVYLHCDRKGSSSMHSDSVSSNSISRSIYDSSNDSQD